MRKIAPAFVLTTLVALSGAALANNTSPADKTYTSRTNPTVNGATTATDTGKGGATVTGSNTGASMDTTGSASVSSTAPIANEPVAVGKSKKRWSAKDCQGIALTDPTYKSHNCGAMKGGAGASGGEGSGGASGASGSSSSGSGN